MVDYILIAYIHGSCFICILTTIQTSYTSFDKGPRSEEGPVLVFVPPAKISLRGPDDILWS